MINEYPEEGSRKESRRPTFVVRNGKVTFLAYVFHSYFCGDGEVNLHQFREQPYFPYHMTVEIGHCRLYSSVMMQV